MPMLDRRRFLHTAAAAATLTTPAARALAQAANPGVALTLHPDRPGPTVPANFIGLSYEIEELSVPTFFSAENTGLIQQFRNLSPHGVLRLGGNTSDVGWFKATPDAQPPVIHTRVVTGEPNASLAYAVTPDAIRNLRKFLDATGWTSIYGINLGTNTPARAAEEAAFVYSTLGPKLEYLQLGNEPDLYKNHLRDPATWTVDAYLDEWLAATDAIRARVPQAKFGLPDNSGAPEWSARIAQRLSAMPRGAGKGTCPPLAALTHHYYFGGPPANPDVNIDRLLRPDPKVAAVAQTTVAAAHQLGIPYRMTEGNTCYRGGKPGVSDVFAAALWAADYALYLASQGYAGINLHGGSAKFVGNSLGGHLPGEDLLKPGDPVQPRPFYTPIADMNGRYVAQPDYIGLSFVQQFITNGATMVPVDFDPGPVNATAYAATLASGQRIVAVINKDAHQPLHLNLPGYSLAQQLTAPALTAYTAQLDEPQSYRELSTVPAGSAALLLNARG